MRFITDLMLGRLARWLRLLGFDTCSGVVEDDEIMRVAKTEDRSLLTRDKQLFESARRLGIRGHYIAPSDLRGQLFELFGKLGVEHLELDPSRSRCPVCNGTIVRVDLDGVADSVPQKVIEYHKEFWGCSSCGKVYWMGTHWEKIEKEINDLNAKLGSESGIDGAG
jgi:uncharacterized protein with PIN domain